MIAIILVVWVNQLKEMRQLILITLRMCVVTPLLVLLVNQPFDVLVQYHRVFCFDELVALLEAAWQETDVLEALTVEHFDDELKHLVVKVPDVQVVVSLARLLTRERTLPKVGRPKIITRFVEIPRHLLRIESEQANVYLVFAIVESLPHLI